MVATFLITSIPSEMFLGEIYKEQLFLPPIASLILKPFEVMIVDSGKFRGIQLMRISSIFVWKSYFYMFFFS